MIPDHLAAGTKEEPPEDEGPPLSDLPGISVKPGLIKAGGNRKLYRKLLSKFRRNHSDVANGIRNALDMDDPDTATRLAHTIKGVAGNIGARNLYLAATDLEAALRQKQIGNIAGLLDAFSEALDLVLNSIADLEPKGRDVAETRRFAQPVLVEETKMSDTGITNTVLVVDDAPENIDLLDGVLNKDYKIKAAYITKPFSPPIVQARVKTHLEKPK